MKKTISEKEYADVETVVTKGRDFIGETEYTKAKVFINSKGNAGNFLCSHVMRIITDLKIYNTRLKSGFIHIPKNPDFNQLAEIISVALIQIILNLEDLKSIKVLISGFTRFGNVENNSTSQFLFNDGVSDNIESFGLINTSKQNIEKIMLYINKYTNLENIILTHNKLSFNLYSKNIDIYFLRLPVDNSFTLDPNKNDITGNLLKEKIDMLKPDSIISLGVGVYDKNDEYNIEINAKGMNNVKYENTKNIPNYDLSLIFKNYFNKEKICLQ